MLPSKKIMVRTALRSSKQNWWPRRVRTRRQSWVGKLNPISKFKWPPQKSFPTLSLAEITCEPCQSALYSLGVADFVWGSWRIGEGQDWGDWSWQEAAGGVVGFGRPKIQASNSWKDGFLEEGLQIIDAMLQWSFYVKIKKTIQDTLGLPNGLFFMRTDFFFENQSCLWDYISMFSYIPLLRNILSALQSSPKIWRSEEIPKAKKEQKASADLEREQSKQVEVSQGSLLETGHGSGGNHWGLGEASQPLIALRGPSVMWSGSHQDIKDTTAALEADGAVSTEVKEFPGVFWRGGGTFFGNTIRFYYESLEDTEADDILEVRID